MLYSIFSLLALFIATMTAHRHKLQDFILVSSFILKRTPASSTGFGVCRAHDIFVYFSLKFS